MPGKDKLLDVPVEILSLASDPPIILSGRVTCRDEETCDVMLDDREHGFAEGMKVIVDAGEATDLRVVGTIGLVQENLIHVESRSLVRRDKRIFPRTYGGIRLRYQVAPPEAGDAWVEKGEAPGETWHTPDPFMDFSGSGLKFEGQENCKAEDALLLELRIPPSEEPLRATARVVRLFPISQEELDAAERDDDAPPSTHQIAVHFDNLPTEAVEALMAFTLRVQDALI
jgi:hypothetical protein